MLLGVSIDNKLTFKNHIDDLRRRASSKLHVLLRIRPFFIKRKSQAFPNVFINCQFLYAPLIWMFASKSSINKICKIYFRTLHIVHNAHEKLYKKLLTISNDISVHRKHLRIMPIDIYKSLMKTTV